MQKAGHERGPEMVMNGAGMNVPNPTFAPTLFAPGSIMENNRCKTKHTSTHKQLKNHSQEHTTLKATIKDSHVNNHNHKHCDLLPRPQPETAHVKSHNQTNPPQRRT